MSDPINPNHYKHLPVEAIDIIDAAIEGAPSPQAAAAQSHLLGYALRANQKGQLAIDAGKAEWYAARWLKAIREAEAKASGANETASDEPSQPAERPKDFIENFFDGVAEILGQSPPKRFYREPTTEDLKNGPICCEVRDWDSEQWKARQLIQVHESGPFRFLCKNESCDNPLNWNQCRIEVTE